MEIALLTQDRLEDIRAADEAVGLDIRFAPQAWQERRELLGHIAATEQVQRETERLTRELDFIMNGGGCEKQHTLTELVAQLRQFAIHNFQPTEPQASPPPKPCGELFWNSWGQRYFCTRADGHTGNCAHSENI